MTRPPSTMPAALTLTLLAVAGCGSGSQEIGQATASLRIASAPIGQSADRVALLTPAAATFSPARPGESAEVETSTDNGDTWSAVAPPASGVQDEDGEVRLELPAVHPDDGAAYRVVGSTEGEDVVSQPVTPAAQVEVFADDFDDPELYGQQWAQRYTDTYHGNRMCATPNPNRLTVADGVLTLSVAKIHEAGARSPGDPDVVCDVGVWDNAMIGTLRAPEPFTFTYGTAAARLRMQPGGGCTAQWTPEQYVFAVDGVVTMVTDQPAVSTKPEEIALSLLTSDWSLSPRTQESSTMQADWVRVWQDPEDAAEQRTP